MEGERTSDYQRDLAPVDALSADGNDSRWLQSRELLSQRILVQDSVHHPRIARHAHKPTAQESECRRGIFMNGQMASAQPSLFCSYEQSLVLDVLPTGPCASCSSARLPSLPPRPPFS
jgi:hypothetical protein